MQFLCVTSFVTMKLLLTLAYSLKGVFFYYTKFYEIPLRSFLDFPLFSSLEGR